MLFIRRDHFSCQMEAAGFCWTVFKFVIVGNVCCHSFLSVTSVCHHNHLWSVTVCYQFLVWCHNLLSVVTVPFCNYSLFLSYVHCFLLVVTGSILYVTNLTCQQSLISQLCLSPVSCVSSWSLSVVTLLYLSSKSHVFGQSVFSVINLLSQSPVFCHCLLLSITTSLLICSLSCTCHLPLGLLSHVLVTVLPNNYPIVLRMPQMHSRVRIKQVHSVRYVGHMQTVYI